MTISFSWDIPGLVQIFSASFEDVITDLLVVFKLFVGVKSCYDVAAGHPSLEMMDEHALNGQESNTSLVGDSGKVRYAAWGQKWAPISLEITFENWLS